MWVPLGEYPKFGTTMYLLDKGYKGQKGEYLGNQLTGYSFKGTHIFPLINPVLSLCSTKRLGKFGRSPVADLEVCTWLLSHRRPADRSTRKLEKNLGKKRLTPRNIHWKKPWLFRVDIGSKLPSSVGIIIDQYKDHY